MCQTVTWESTACKHEYIFKPFGECWNPRQDRTCYRPLQRTTSNSPCLACLAAAAGRCQRLMDQCLDQYRAEERKRRPPAKLLKAASKQLLPPSPPDEPAAGRKLRSLIAPLLEAADGFNEARARFKHDIEQVIYRSVREGFRGYKRLPDHLYPDNHDRLPGYAPVEMYRDLLRYLDETPSRPASAKSRLPERPLRAMLKQYGI
ncbi:MAG: hypothetical protein M1826_006925 [Phylliscum demangeonii]|nr:MAG: hypothetical protein M1826_006925 [Phylliscum demangeonii]